MRELMLTVRILIIASILPATCAVWGHSAVEYKRVVPRVIVVRPDCKELDCSTLRGYSLRHECEAGDGN